MYKTVRKTIQNGDPENTVKLESHDMHKNTDAKSWKWISAKYHITNQFYLSCTTDSQFTQSIKI